MGMRMGMVGMDLASGAQGGGDGDSVTPSIFTIAAGEGGTKYIRIQLNETLTLTTTGDVEIKLGSGGTWATSVEVAAGAVNRDIYFKSTAGGTLVIPNAANVTYLYLDGTGTSISGSITGMALTYLLLVGTGTAITGSITGVALTYLFLSGTGITGSITGMALTYLYLSGTGTAISGSIDGMALTYLFLVTGTAISGSITGMALTYLYLSGTGTAISGSITGMALTSLYLNGTGTAIDYTASTTPFNNLTGAHGVRLLGTSYFPAAQYDKLFEHAAAEIWTVGRAFAITTGTAPTFSDIATDTATLIGYRRADVTLPSAWLTAANTIALLTAIKNYSLYTFATAALTIKTYSGTPSIQDIIDDVAGDAHTIHDLIADCLARADVSTITLNATAFNE